MTDEDKVEESGAPGPSQATMDELIDSFRIDRVPRRETVFEKQDDEFLRI